MQDKSKQNDSIDDIVNIIVGSSDKTDADPVSVELVFGVEGASSAPDTTDKSTINLNAPKETPLLSFGMGETDDGAYQAPTELSVPDEFVIEDVLSEEFEIPVSNVPYVPRFTGATEKYISHKGKSETSTKPIQKPTADAVDPTAEIYNEDDVEISVATSNVKQMTTRDELGSESSSQVFKFPENEIDVPEEAEEREQTPSPQPIAEEPIKKEEIKEEKNPEAPREYAIPDPHSESGAVVSYATSQTAVARATLHDAPLDVGEADDGKHPFKEYSSYAQRDVCKDRFLDVLISVKLRFFVSLLLSFLLLAFETLCAFGVNIPFVSQMNFVGSTALFDIPFVVCLYLIAIPEIVISFRALVRKKAVPELFITTSFIITLLYDVYCTSFAVEKYPLFGFLFATFVISAIVSNHYKKNAEFITFKVVSENREKKVIDTKLTRTLEKENSVLDGIVEEHKSKTARLFRTVFVSDFFKRCERISENSRGVIITLISTLSFSLVTGAIAYFIPGGMQNALVTFALVFLLGTPAMSTLTHKLTFYYSTKESLSLNGCAVGEASILDVSEVDVITFEDTEIFGNEDVTLQRILLYGNSENLTKALCQMSALFTNVGGPLDHLFSSSLDRKPSPADNTYIEIDGVGGELDGHEILAGSLEYMKRKGATLPLREGASLEAIPDSTRIMYASEDGVVYAKFYIRYSFSEDFSMLLPVLCDEGIKPLIYTRDPNLTGEVVKTLTAGVDRMRLLKKTNSPEKDDLLYRKVSAGLVTYGDKLDGINMILNAKRYARLISRISNMETIAMLVGSLLAVVLSLCSMSLVPSFVFGAWQIAWCTVVHVISKRSFSVKNNKK